jgi:hypothetical protein
MPSPTGSISRRHKPSRLRCCEYPPRWTNYPWGFAKDEFGSQQADFMGVLGSLLVHTAKDEFGDGA